MRVVTPSTRRQSNRQDGSECQKEVHLWRQILDNDSGRIAVRILFISGACTGKKSGVLANVHVQGVCGLYRLPIPRPGSLRWEEFRHRRRMQIKVRGWGISAGYYGVGVH